MRPHSRLRFTLGVVLLILTAAGFVSSIFSNGLLVKALCACFIPGLLLTIHGWRGPDSASHRPDSRKR